VSPEGSIMPKSHTTLGKVIHWTFILLYTYGILKQIDDLSQLQDNNLLIFEVIFATLFLFIVIARYIYMRRFETFQGAFQPVHKIHKYFAKTIHSSIYLCLIILPLTGLMIAGLYKQGYTDEEGLMLSSMMSLHGLAADLSYLLILIHIVAAVWSRIKGEGVWASMVPLWKDESETNNEFIKKLSSLENYFFNAIEGFFISKNKKV